MDIPSGTSLGNFPVGTRPSKNILLTAFNLSTPTTNMMCYLNTAGLLILVSSGTIAVGNEIAIYGEYLLS